MPNSEFYRAEIIIDINDKDAVSRVEQAEKRIGGILDRMRQRGEALGSSRFEPLISVKDKLSDSVLRANKMLSELGKEKAEPVIEARDRVTAVANRIKDVMDALNKGDIKLAAEMQGPLLDEITQAKGGLRVLENTKAGPVAELRGELFEQLTEAYTEVKRLGQLAVEPRATLWDQVTGKTREIGGSLKQLTSKAWSVVVDVKDRVTASIKGIISKAGRLLSHPLALLGIGGGAAGVTGAGLKMVMDEQDLASSFEVMLGSRAAAEKRIQDLIAFAGQTPYTRQEVWGASQQLEILTGGALSTGDELKRIGDIAAGTLQPFEDVAIWMGRLYDGLESGRPIGQAAMRLQEMGAISGESRARLEKLAESGKDISKIWPAAAKEFDRFAGLMEKQSKNLRNIVLGTKTFFTENIIKRLGQGMADALYDSLNRFREWRKSNAETIGRMGAAIEQFGRKAGNAITGFADKLVNIGRSLAFGTEATLFAKGLRDRVDAERKAAEEAGQHIRRELEKAWALPLPEIAVPGIANLFGSINVVDEYDPVQIQLEGFLGSSREQVEALEKAYKGISPEIGKIAQETPYIMLPDVKAGKGKGWDEFNKTWESMGGMASITVEQLQRTMEEVQQIIPQPKELNAMEKAWANLEEQLIAVDKTYAGLTLSELQELMPKLKLEPTSGKLIKEELERLLRLTPVQIQRIGISEGSLDNITMGSLERALEHRAELERITIPLLGDVVPYMNIDELETLADKIEQKGEFKARLEATWKLMVWEPLMDSMDSVIDWLEGEGGNKIVAAFTAIGEAAVKGFMLGMKSLGKKSVEQLKEGNPVGAAVPAATMWMLGGGALAKGSLKLGKGLWNIGKGALKGSKNTVARLDKFMFGRAAIRANALEATNPLAAEIVRGTYGMTSKTAVPATKVAAETVAKTAKISMPVTSGTAGATKVAAETAKATSSLTKALPAVANVVKKVALPIAVAAEVYDIAKADNKAAATTKSLAGWGGAAAGAKLGSVIGTAILPGIGTVIGSGLGGIGGYIAGKWVADKAINASGAGQTAIEQREHIEESIARTGQNVSEQQESIVKTGRNVSERQESIARTGQVYLNTQGDIITSNGFVINSQNDLMQAFTTLVQAVDCASAKLIAFSGIEFIPPVPASGIADFKRIEYEFQGGEHSSSVTPVTPYAQGDILTRPHLGLVAEAGPEVIIPLSTKMRSRALNLFQKTGEILGVRPYAAGGFAGLDTTDIKPEQISPPGYAAPAPVTALTTVDKRNTSSNINVRVDGINVQMDSGELDYNDIAKQVGWKVVTELKKALVNRG